MSIRGFIAIASIFTIVSIAWLTLGGSVRGRTESLDRRLSGEMASLWGPSVLAQCSPYWAERSDAARESNGAVSPSVSRVNANIRHNHRNKGLLWFSTFTVDFDGQYTVPAAPTGSAGQGFVLFALPRGVNGYDDLSATVNDVPVELRQDQIATGWLALPVSRASPATVRVRYSTNGQDAWLYCPAAVPEKRRTSREMDNGEPIDLSGPAGPLASLNDFSLTVQTDFPNIDYPKGSRSPSQPAETANPGVKATWKFTNALTNQPMGIVMPHHPNAGPIVARMSFFAPVSLFFFFTVVFTVVVLKGLRLHPMHYVFLGAGFFAFHILLAYLVDKVSLHLAYWICAAVSVLLVVSYIRLVAGIRFAVLYIGAAQLVYLIGFCYAFFFPGWTGLTVVIGAVVTLFVLMQTTGRINWFEVFKSNPPVAPLPTIPPPNAQGKKGPTLANIL